jgi:3alpha(or 20beta)-hydroxysteroid dehydrogenase
MGRLQDKVAMVTGSAMGQGEAEVRAFVAEGARVVVSDVVDEAGARIAESLGDAAVYQHLDVSNPDDWARVVEDVVDRWGKLDVLVNNAGFMVRGSAENVRLEDWNTAIAVMQTGPMLGMRAAVPAMKLAGSGSIINVSSTAGLRGTRNTLPYTAAKFAVRGMSKAAAMDLAQYKIRVNSVHPGVVNTPFFDALMPDRPADFLHHLALADRPATPDDIAPLMVYLASDESSFCSGAEFIIDSGASCGQWGT